MAENYRPITIRPEEAALFKTACLRGSRDGPEGPSSGNGVWRGGVRLLDGRALPQRPLPDNERGKSAALRATIGGLGAPRLPRASTSCAHWAHQITFGGAHGSRLSPFSLDAVGAGACCMRLRNILFIAGSMLVAAFTSFGQPKDVAGSKDPALFTRMPGFYITKTRSISSTPTISRSRRVMLP